MAKAVVPLASVPGSKRNLMMYVRGAKNHLKFVTEDCRPLAADINYIRQHEGWKAIYDDEPRTWERFCDDLGVSPDWLSVLLDGVARLEKEGHTGPVPIGELRPHRRPTKQEQENKGDNGTFKRGSNSQEYQLARLKRDRPDILEAYQAGDYPSVRQAAIAAGIVKVKSDVEKAVGLWHRFTPEEREEFCEATGLTL